MLRIVIDKAGAVQEVSAVSGDPILAQAASDAVKQWRYKPYLLDDSPAEIETQVTLNFHVAAQRPIDPPPAGSFREGTYTNEYFALSYPVAGDWVRVTEITRSRLESKDGSSAAKVLLSLVHIPQDLTELRADSSFALVAVPRSAQTATENCKQYLDALASALLANKSAKQKGEIREYAVAGREFSRADFEYRTGYSNQATICSADNHYLLLWEIEGLSRKGVDLASSTINAIVPWPPPAKPATLEPSAANAPKQVRVAQGVSAGLLIKKVQAVYPPLARSERIQGTVRMRAVIGKTGDIEDLELIDGPIELAVSAVTAVRQWKYRPYLLNGEPVRVLSEIVVNYALSR